MKDLRRIIPGNAPFALALTPVYGIDTVYTAEVARIQNSACYSFVYAHWRDYPFYHSLFLMAMKDPR
jgi:hypothetical protein